MTPPELGTYFQRSGVPPAQIFGAAPGGQGEAAGVKYRIVHTHHGTGCTLPQQPMRQYAASTRATS